MPAWPGGPCPQCGEEMPEKLIHCQNCRALLNPELPANPVALPEFVPLPELDALVQVAPSGYYVDCVHCRRELRIPRSHARGWVECKFCRAAFRTNGSSRDQSPAFYARCPHCRERLRVAWKYMGQTTACKHCRGKIQFVRKSPQ